MRLYEHELLIRRMLTESGVDSPGLCARLLAAHAANLSKTEYVLAWNRELTLEQEQRLNELALRRAKGEPLAYLLERKEFYDLEFKVTRATLTPRPETELLVELALAQLPETEPIVFADIGCGTGCIGLTLLKLRPHWQGILLDNSLPAIAVAITNAQRHQLAPAIIAGDLFNLPFACQSLNLLVSNPPYIARAESNFVMAETLAYEPHSALFSADNGLAHLDAVIIQAARVLRKGGLLLVEHGYKQSEAVLGMLGRQGYGNITGHKDLAGLQRCASAFKQNGE